MSYQRATTAFAFVATLLLGSVTAVPASVASPQSDPTNVSSVHVESDAAKQYRSTIDLKFDKPVSSKLADTYAKKLASEIAPAQLGPEYISCGGNGRWSDTNGSLTLQYTCSTTDRLAWSYAISSAVKAIIVSNVTEQGLDWWVNGTKMPRNAPHVVPKDYLLHGTMSGAKRNSTVDYQDYLTFRHNLGGGGTGSITWAGRVHTLAD
ncbi:hypothetical protein [Kribbella sp. NPDC023855]|uniref:hypothetical protein n=1 Tax=Kribbella sp. NPDC023855 TaxID=3154698 RepID=UPI0033F2754C